MYFFSVCTRDVINSDLRSVYSGNWFRNVKCVYNQSQYRANWDYHWYLHNNFVLHINFSYVCLEILNTCTIIPNQDYYDIYVIISRFSLVNVSFVCVYNLVLHFLPLHLSTVITHIKFLASLINCILPLPFPLMWLTSATNWRMKQDSYRRFSTSRRIAWFIPRVD